MKLTGGGPGASDATRARLGGRDGDPIQAAPKLPPTDEVPPPHSEPGPSLKNAAASVQDLDAYQQAYAAGFDHGYSTGLMRGTTLAIEHSNEHLTHIVNALKGAT